MSDSGPEPEPPPTTWPRELPPWIRRVGLASWYFIGFCAAVGLFAFLFAASSDISIPLILGIFLAVVFQPLVDWLANRGLSRGFAAVLVVVLVVVVAAGVVLVVAFGIGDQSEALAASLDQAVVALRGWAADLNIDPEIVDRAREAAAAGTDTATGGLAHQAFGLVNSAVGLVAGIILGLVILYYLLKDGQAMMAGLIEHAAEADREQYRRIVDDSAGSTQAYAKGRTVLALIQGVVIGIAAALLGVPLAFSIGVVNFIGAYIPYLGAFIGGAFAVLLAISEGGIGLALIMLAVVLVVNLALENLLEPRLVGDAMDLHPLVILIVTVLGGLVGGLVGLILAAPLTAIGLNLYRELKLSGFFD